MKSSMLIVLLLLILALFVPSSTGQIATLVPLPADLQGELNGVPYLIRVPANWTGTLLVYAYGYGDAANTPLLTPPYVDAKTLLDRGFALAGIFAAHHVPVPPVPVAGWNMKERMQNTAALTAAFRGLVGQPERTIMWGQSMGGLMTLGMIEKFPELYDGAVALCPPAAGSPRRFDQGLDVTLAYAVVFGWNDQWGTPGDLRDNLDFRGVAPYILANMTPAQYGLWEFIRRVNRIPPDTYYDDANRLQNLYFAIGVRAELEHRAGGAVAENIGRIYTLTEQDQSELSALGVDGYELLAKMNEMNTFNSDPNARNYAIHYVNPTGRITRPIITLHTEGDWLATPNHEGAYRATVKDQGKGDLLMQEFVPGGAHCTFKLDQVLAGINAMMSWLDTGTRPEPSVFFPAALGFDPSYVPEPWPW